MVHGFLVADGVERVVSRLDAAVAEAKQVIGRQNWQRLTDGPITYYFVDEEFVASGSGDGDVFVPAAFIRQEGRAPLLFLAIQELLQPRRSLPFGQGNDPDVRLADVPYSVSSGIRSYVTRLVAERSGFRETGFDDLGTLATIDELCAKRLRTVDPTKVLPYMGEAGRPPEAVGPERTTIAPAFSACAMSFAKFLVDRSDLPRVIGLLEKLPDGVKAVQAEIARITGQAVSGLRTEWQRKIGVPAADAMGGDPSNSAGWQECRISRLRCVLR